MNQSCPLFGKCGGCQTPNLSYEDQLHMKMRRMIGTMGRYCHVDEIVRMESPYRYRTKVQSAFTRMGSEMRAGIYQSSTGHVLPAKTCLLEDERAGVIRRTVEKLAQEMRLTVYSPKNGKGLLRHVMIRIAHTTGDALVAVVTGTAPFPKSDEFVSALTERCPAVKTVVRIVNDTKTPLWMGGEEQILFGPGTIEEQLLGKPFLISAKAFFQINPVQAERLYGIALDLAGLTGTENVMDCYCGVGTVGILAADKAKFVTGVEIVEDAVEDARVNAARNGLVNVRFECADAGEYLRTHFREKPDVVFLDPPREGCSKELLNSLKTFAPKKIVYISCNPDTLGRDVGFLSHAGYKADRCVPVDMFPMTGHVETVVLLSRK